MNNLRQYREKQGLKRSDVAKMLNVSDRAILYWETEQRIPNVYIAISLAKVFNCNIEDLFISKPER